jgi:hypothetical protein
MPYDGATSLLGISQEQSIQLCPQETGAEVLTAEMFVVALTGNQPELPSTARCVKTAEHLHNERLATEKE